jgi:serine/threonine protein kinase
MLLSHVGQQRVLFEKYYLISVLHQGSTTLYLASYEGSNYIVKVVGHTQGHPTLSLLKREFSILNHLEPNPYILKPLEFLDDNKRAAIVWSEVPGFTSLSNFIKIHKHLSVDVFIKLADQMAEALHSVHSKGVIHRDISSQNFLVHTETHQIKLIDFNYASFWREYVGNNLCAETRTPVCGTSQYFSPEHTGKVQHQIDFRSDLYSLGVVFHEMLLGRTPFAAITRRCSLIYAHAAVKIPSIHRYQEIAVPIILGKIVGKLLEKDPKDRYQSAAGLRKDLQKSVEYLNIFSDNRDLSISVLNANLNANLDRPLEFLMNLSKYTSQNNLSVKDDCPFPLGTNDKCSYLKAVNTLYGREIEIKEILRLWKRSKNEAAAVFVKGFPGLGKS